MDKLTRYRELIKQILTEHVELDRRQPQPGVESLLVADEANDHYIWMNLGWEGGKRTNGATVYVRLHNGKFWIEEDWTEEGVAAELLADGVPNEDIVLAFQSPAMRPYTEFAAA